MLFVISLVIMVLVLSSTIWLRNRWIIDTFNSYGVYSNMAGLYLYRKFGLWHIGTPQENPLKKTKPQGEHSSIVVGELDLKPGYREKVETYS